MVASRDINPLELILKEDPAVVGPYTNTMQGCLQCLRKVDGTYTCTGCGFPMCNSKCERGLLHRDECQFFQTKEFSLCSKQCTPLSQAAAALPKSSPVTSPMLKPSLSSESSALLSLKRIPPAASAMAVASITKGVALPHVPMTAQTPMLNPAATQSMIDPQKHRYNGYF